MEIYSLRLSSLPISTRRLLSSLLNPPKVIPSDGPDRLPRDWRGLATRINISSQVASYIQQCEDKTAKVLEYWLQQNGSATVGDLLSHLEYIDRFDVCDDVCEDLTSAITSGQLSVGNGQASVPRSNNISSASTEGDVELLTFDDRPGHIQIYDALVLYVEEDKPFVEEMRQRMGRLGYQICTADDLHVGHAAPYGPMAQLISERCLRIIMVFSPEFVSRHGVRFYMDYAQADSIESNQRKLIPIIYRSCTIPSHLSFYHKLNYNTDSTLFDFWSRLRQTLDTARLCNANQQRRQLMSTQQPPQITIEQYPSTHSLEHRAIEDGVFLPNIEMRTTKHAVSMSELDSLDIQTIKASEDSRSCHSQVSDNSVIKKKKKNYFRKLFSTFGKKTKKPIMIAG